MRWWINSFFTNKKGAPILSVLPLLLVDPTGEVSNFLFEDFDAVLKFMNAEMQKKKLSLK
jgi:hypothetical protein